MKQTYTMILALGLMLLSKPALSAEMIQVKVKGFVCALCGQGVEKKLNAVSQQGIANYAVNMDSKVVSFNLKPGVTLSDQEITQAITKAGYAVENIQREPEEGSEKKQGDASKVNNAVTPTTDNAKMHEAHQAVKVKKDK